MTQGKGVRFMTNDITIIQELLDQIKTDKIKIGSDKEHIITLLEKYIKILEEEEKQFEQELKEWSKPQE